MTDRPPTNPELDLVLEREVDVPTELVWRAWTEPDHLMRWFTPAPWTTVACEIDLRPGGLFKTTMRSPEGQDMESEGCYLEIVPQRRLVWTDVLAAHYRPVRRTGEGAPFGFTATILLEPVGSNTRYTAIAMHGDPATREKHEEMGFHTGWGTALEQLVAVARTM